MGNNAFAPGDFCGSNGSILPKSGLVVLRMTDSFVDYSKIHNVIYIVKMNLI
jgi:hypothetical protein